MSHPDSESELTRRALLPAGLRDVLPLDAAHEARVIEALLAQCAAHGYDRVKPPLVEFEASLFAGPGAAMSDKTFRLMDPVSQKMMGVRADMTVQIARIATTRLKSEPRPLRLCYAGEVLRVSANQLSPERELVQVGAELLGGDSVAADVEPILLAVEALRSIGVQNLSVDLTAPRVIPVLLGEAELDPDTLAALRAAIDRKHASEVSKLAGPMEPVLTDLMAAAGAWQDSLKQLQSVSLPEAARAAIDRIASIAESVSAVEPELAMTIDPVENRGFEYYTGYGFSLFSRGVRGELGRGGRYRVDGGEGLRSAGFTLYMETVMRALPEPVRPDRLYLPFGTSAETARALRAEGWITIAGLDKEGEPALEASRLGCSHLLKDGAPAAL
ncbi:ATP phosphoribosyltransferase regulatory subunit [Nisaea acidiphila]|uniref:ATP phosphoribosyltransferase regulatory subunit n=1 Tax=Nisaea acidiphila TaxID=1862145 RepID=A0A9J7AQ75_9PROT|nr:ATP phosphoribosyltransferase regulatory subunit [Nisaea acidiphila]UUX49050.1 ATP phosphoribosyltransferase regulatory subunit [Nisaea acidiphila]